MDLAWNLLHFLPDLEQWDQAKLYHIPHGPVTASKLCDTLQQGPACTSLNMEDKLIKVVYGQNKKRKFTCHLQWNSGLGKAMNAFMQ